MHFGGCHLPSAYCWSILMITFHFIPSSGAIVRFRFLYFADYLLPGSTFLFREGRAKGHTTSFTICIFLIWRCSVRQPSAYACRIRQDENACDDYCYYDAYTAAKRTLWTFFFHRDWEGTEGLSNKCRRSCELITAFYLRAECEIMYFSYIFPPFRSVYSRIVPIMEEYLTTLVIQELTACIHCLATMKRREIEIVFVSIEAYMYCSIVITSIKWNVPNTATGPNS